MTVELGADQLSAAPWLYRNTEVLERNDDPDDRPRPAQGAGRGEAPRAVPRMGAARACRGRRLGDAQRAPESSPDFRRDNSPLFFSSYLSAVRALFKLPDPERPDDAIRSDVALTFRVRRRSCAFLLGVALAGHGALPATRSAARRSTLGQPGKARGGALLRHQPVEEPHHGLRHLPLAGFRLHRSARDRRSAAPSPSATTAPRSATATRRLPPMRASARPFTRAKTGNISAASSSTAASPDLEGQAGDPPLNPIEMGMPDKASVVARLKENPDYVTPFRRFSTAPTRLDDTDAAYRAMTEAIAAFERTKEFAPFDSKYDRYLRGEAKLSDQEELGRVLFFSQQFTNCYMCHQLQAHGGMPEETFTNYQYHNIGVPKNDAVRAANGSATDRVDQRASGESRRRRPGRGRKIQGADAPQRRRDRALHAQRRLQGSAHRRALLRQVQQQARRRGRSIPRRASHGLRRRCRGRSP